MQAKREAWTRRISRERSCSPDGSGSGTGQERAGRQRVGSGGAIGSGREQGGRAVGGAERSHQGIIEHWYTRWWRSRQSLERGGGGVLPG
jgi:hypothetical protein